MTEKKHGKKESKKKKALITGVTGQDGPYLAKLLLEKGYEVYGAFRRTSTNEFINLKKLRIFGKITLVEFDLMDRENMRRVFEEIMPDEIYNLAAQSHVHVSFKQPLLTQEINFLSVLYILEMIRNNKPDTKIYQASTSEMFGKVQEVPQTEKTPFYPRSPYGVVKLASYWMIKNYRESYGIFACNGILFNHESPIRGPEFVTRKITRKVAGVKKGATSFVELGNLDSKRDWGFAGDYVKAMYLMMQKEKPDDYVIATGETHSVRDLAESAFKAIGREIVWDNSEKEMHNGVNIKEKGLDKSTGEVLVKINKEFVRPVEVELLIGNPAKAKKVLGWESKVKFEELIKMMVEADLSDKIEY